MLGTEYPQACGGIFGKVVNLYTARAILHHQPLRSVSCRGKLVCFTCSSLLDEVALLSSQLK